MSKIHLPIEEGETPKESVVGEHKDGEFNPCFMYGEFLYYKHGDVPDICNIWVDEDYRLFVPEDCWNRVEIIHKEKICIEQDPFTFYNSIGWKYTPKVMETPKGNEMAAFIESRLSGKGGGMMSYKKNGYRYTIQKTKVDNE